MKNFQFDFAFVRSSGEEGASGYYNGMNSQGVYYEGTYDASVEDTQDRFILSLIYKF